MRSVFSISKLRKRTVWNGGAWSNGLPDAYTDVVLNAVYDTSLHGSFNCYNLYLDSVKLTITAHCHITVVGPLVSQSSSAFNIKNQGEFILLNKDVDVSSVKLTIERVIEKLQRLDYWFLSSPLSGITLLQISPKTITTRFYTYSEASNTYSVIDPAKTIFTPGSGWLIRMPNDAPITVSDWKITMDNLKEGSLNKGVITQEVTKDKNGYSIIGNPYSGKLSLRKFYEANKDIVESVFYVWHKTNNSDSPSYMVLNKVMGSRDSWDINLLPFQGFMVQKKEIGKTNIIFTPDMQIVHEEFSIPDRFYLNLLQENINIPLASASYNVQKYPIDFAEHNLSDVGISFIENDKLFDLKNALTWNVKDEIRLQVKIFTAANYTISLSSFSGFFTDTQFYLFDSELNITHDLKKDGYVFSADSKTYDTRFKLKFQPK